MSYLKPIKGRMNSIYLNVRAVHESYPSADAAPFSMLNCIKLLHGNADSSWKFVDNLLRHHNSVDKVDISIFGLFYVVEI